MSVPKLILPVPSGIISISALDVETISLPLISRSPPSWGVVSLSTVVIAGSFDINTPPAVLPSPL